MTSFEFLVGDGFLQFTNIDSVLELFHVLKESSNFGAIFHDGDSTIRPHIHLLYSLDKNANTKIKRLFSNLKSVLGNRIRQSEALYQYLKLIAIKIDATQLPSVCDSLLATPKLRSLHNIGNLSMPFSMSNLGKGLQRVIQQGPAIKSPRACLSHFKQTTVGHAQVSENLEQILDAVGEEATNSAESNQILPCQKNAARWDFISQLIDRTGTDSVNALQRVMPESDYKDLLLRCGITWKNLVAQVSF